MARRMEGPPCWMRAWRATPCCAANLCEGGRGGEELWLKEAAVPRAPIELYSSLWSPLRCPLFPLRHSGTPADESTADSAPESWVAILRSYMVMAFVFAHEWGR